MATHGHRTPGASPGFTLLELVIVSAIFGFVLTMAYQILTTTLNADDRINQVTQSGRIGPAILGLLRRDIQGVVFHELGPKVFIGIDNGDRDGATDEIHFVTTAPVPEPREELEYWTGEVSSVGYVLKDSNTGDEGTTLFRRVEWQWDEDEDPFEDGQYTAIYERVRALSFRFLDEHGEWLDSWDSEERFDALQELKDLEAEGAAEEDSENDPAEEEEIPPLLVPRAVEIYLYLYLGDETGILRDDRNEPVIEEYHAVVPLIASESLEVAEELMADEQTGG